MSVNRYSKKELLNTEVEAHQLFQTISLANERLSVPLHTCTFGLRDVSSFFFFLVFILVIGVAFGKGELLSPKVWFSTLCKLVKTNEV